MNLEVREHSQTKNYIDNFIKDSDAESEDESESGTDTSDTDVNDTDIANTSFNKVKNKSLPTNYNGLTFKQKQAYHQICNLFTNNKGVIVAINARSGTGKTFLLTILTQYYADDVQFITFRRDEASGMSLKLNNCATTYTYMSFYVNCFHLPYFRAVQLFNTSEADDVDLLYKLILYSKKYLHTGTKIIIVDSCTIPSATMLLLLYILSLKHRIHLIFAGNKIQLSAMHKSSLHSRSNFDLIKKISNATIRKLTDERSSDKTLKNRLSQFYRMIQQNRPKNEVPFHFNLRYNLYRCFRSKYFTEERFDTLFMAQFHQIITNRLNRFIDYLNKMEIRYFIAPFCLIETNAIKPIPTKSEGKFFPGLILVEGYKYIHINPRGVHNVVLLEEIASKNGIATDVKVRFLHDNRTMRLTPCQLNYYQILPAYRAWLVSQNAKLQQFPLRPYTLTYHAALGQTIDEEMVELSADCSFANTIYVGLCCIRSYDNIKKIHAEKDLPSFVVTDYMRKEHDDDKYYYRCPAELRDCDRNKIMRYVHENGPNSFIDNISWRTVDVIQNFERKQLTFYARIPCALYEKPSVKSQNKGDTRLMKIADFVKDKFNVILDTMINAPIDDIDKYNKKEKNMGYRQSNAYISLKKEYENWMKIMCDKEE